MREQTVLNETLALQPRQSTGVRWDRPRLSLV